MRRVATFCLPLLAAGCFETEDPKALPATLGAAIGLSVPSLSFSAAGGGPDPADQTFTLTNTGGAPLPWTSTPSAPWFSALPSGGTLAPGASVLLTVHVDADFQTEAWEAATSTVSAPAPRYVHSAAFVDGEMIVWGGNDPVAPNTQLGTGARFDPASNLWIGATSLADVPTERHLHSAVSTGTEMLMWGGWKFGVGFFNTGARYTPDDWAGALNVAGAPEAREAHSAVWTGTRMIVWGGWNGSAHRDTGGVYDPVTNNWVGTTSTLGSPGARQEHAAVWTGSRMIVWGGRNGPTIASVLGTGGLYDPVGDSWTGSTAAPGATLSARTSASAVWTGREMVIWGGKDGAGLKNTGARYSPATNTWLGAVAAAGAPAARSGHSAVWTGSRMVVWGGNTAGGVVDTGGIWRPPVPALGDHAETLTISSPGVSAGVLGVDLTITPGQISLSTQSLSFTASASGLNPTPQVVLISKTAGPPSALNWTVRSNRPWLQFTPSFGTTPGAADTLSVSAVVNQAEAWTTSTSLLNAPNGQEDGSAVWTGKEMIVWGGHGPVGTMVNTGARYDPASDTWTGTTSTLGAPSPRWGHSAVWTGQEMIVWGGAPSGSPPLADGYRYDPASDTWNGPISAVGAPSARRVHAAVWTGEEMLIWGGLTAGGATNTGARYDPKSDTWTTITTTGAPTARDYLSAVWNGSRMLVFGGTDNNGLHYDPTTDSWGSPTSTTGAPARNNPCVVWTGTEMIVWSGFDGATQPNTGARYDSGLDAWQAMTTTNAPAGRRSGVAVWTGPEMIIWGGYDGASFNNNGQRYVPPIALTPGVYTATLTIEDPAISNSPQTVDVTLTVTP